MNDRQTSTALLSLAVLASVFFGEVAAADNPIVIGQGLTDPKVRVYGERAYLYATHDASPTAKNFRMNDWWTWSSDDLVHWKYESTLEPQQTYWAKPCDQCWATDAISRHGKYFFYFSRGDNELGVVQGDTPIGPWTDPLHKPLVAAGSVATQARDPAILQEADGTTYLVFGCWDYYIARLKDDMISLAEAPRKLQLDRKFGPYGEGKTDDKSFLHKYHDKYYLSWGCFYAMADNIYGPYTYKGCIITKERTAPEFQKRLVYDRHASIFEFHYQWYFICNDQSWPGTTSHFRDSIISYLHYRANGEIEPVIINQIGVGQYDATQSLIEAANYFRADGVTQQQGPAGDFDIEADRDGGYAEFPNVMNIPANATIHLRTATNNPAGGTIEIHANSVDGPLLGTCPVPGKSNSGDYRTLSAELTNKAGKHDLYLVFREQAAKSIRLNGFSFHAQP